MLLYSSALWARDTMPAGCGVDWLGLPGKKALPAVPVLSLLATVLPVMLALTVSCNAMPPPAAPAMLLTTLLLVSVNWYQDAGVPGARRTSRPLMNSERMPPPSPEPAWLPCIRLDDTVTLPLPGESSVVASETAPPTRIPPPETFCSWLNVWLKITVLLEIVPLLLRPTCAMPPPPLMEKLPQT